MVVCLRVWESRPFGGQERVMVELTPEEVNDLTAAELRLSPNPPYQRDPSYNWGKPKRRRQR